MTGLVLHPLRIRALDRMKVLRVPFREQPMSVCPQTHKAIPYCGPDGLLIERIKPPYAPGEYFVREITWEPTSMIIRDCYYDLDINQKQFEALRNLFYKKIPAGRMNPDFARYLLTLGPPVPCRLGEVDVVQQRDEGVIIDIGDEYRRTWDALYPKHPFSPDRWTWGYPMEVRR